MNRALLVFAQVATTSRGRGGELTPPVRHLFVLLIIVVIAFVLTGVVVYYYRRRLLNESVDQPDAPLALSDVRAMHRSGQIDDDEMERLMERLKRRVLDGYRENYDLSGSPAQRDERDDEGAPGEEDSRKMERPSDDAEDSEDHEDE